MIKWILQKIVGSKNQRELRRIRPTVTRINQIEETLHGKTEEELREMTAKWKAHLARYHVLEAPAKPMIERMGDEELRATADLLEQRLTPLRDEFPSLPAMIEPTRRRSKPPRPPSMTSSPNSARAASNTSKASSRRPTRSSKPPPAASAAPPSA
jgi:preprotein translocase subunit SecA